MAETINTLLKRVRNKVKDYPTDVDYLASAVVSASTILRFGDAEKMNPDDIIEIGEEAIFLENVPRLGGYMDETSELSVAATAFSVANSANFLAGDEIKIDAERMKVGKVSAIGTDNIKVTRSQRGTDAAVHNQTSPVYLTNVIRSRRGQLGTSASAHTLSGSVNIVDRWADYEVREAIKMAIRNLYPDVYRDYVGKVNFKNENNFVILDDCDAVTSWNEGDDAAAVVLNTTDQAEGTGCLNLGGTFSAGSANYTKAITSADISKCNYITIYFSLKDHVDSDKDYYLSQQAFTVILGNTDASNSYAWTVQRNDIEADGNLHRIVLAIDDATETGTFDKTIVDYAHINVRILQDVTSGDIKMDAWIASSFPFTSKGKRSYRLPKGVFGVNDVRLVDDEFGNIYQDIQYWHVEGDYEKMYLVFDIDPPKDKAIEIYGRQLFLVPSSNTAEMDGEVDHIKELIEVDAAIKLNDDLIAQKARYDKYVGNLESGQGILDVYRSRQALIDRYNILFDKFSRSIGATDLDWTDLNNRNQDNSSIINN